MANLTTTHTLVTAHATKLQALSSLSATMAAMNHVETGRFNCLMTTDSDLGSEALRTYKGHVKFTHAFTALPHLHWSVTGVITWTFIYAFPLLTLLHLLLTALLIIMTQYMPLRFNSLPLDVYEKNVWCDDYYCYKWK